MTRIAGSARPFIPEDFEVPRMLETDIVRLRMLSISDAVKDYDAVMSSGMRLYRVLSPTSEWPIGLTLEQNLIDLGWHQKEFQRRSSFAYTVVTLDESRVVGCVYIDPTDRVGYDAEVYCWTRPEDQTSEITDEGLFYIVQNWMKEWPFQAPAYPGRSIDWPTWNALPQVVPAIP